MNPTLLALAASATVALAGPMDYAPAPMVPAPAPSGGWLENVFVAGSVGYLQESEEEMWHLQIGCDLQPRFAGMSQAIFLEVGYNEMEFFNVEQTIVPLTLNYKLERPLTGALSLYAGAGAGIAFYEVSGAVDSDDTVFWGQIFGGLVYNFSESFEVFGGLRGLFLDEVEINGFTTDSGDDLLWEIGARFNF
jgi:hypothetical protein